MRLNVLLQRTARMRRRYAHAINASPFSDSQASDRLHAVFGEHIRQLPSSLTMELLRPDLQRWSYREGLFRKLYDNGRITLTVLLNDHLGTKNVMLPRTVLAQFSDIHRLDSIIWNQRSGADGINLLLECVGAVHTFVGAAECQDMVRRHILDGSLGVSNLYLEALSNNTV